MLLAPLPRQRAATPGWQRHKKSSVIENTIQKINVSKPKCRIIPNGVGLIHPWLNSEGQSMASVNGFYLGPNLRQKSGTTDESGPRSSIKQEEKTQRA